MDKLINNTKGDTLSSIKPNISVGNTGGLDQSRKVIDINTDDGSTVGLLVSHYRHWFSGGDFTTSSLGVPTVAYSQSNMGVAIGSLPQENQKAYYRLNYGDKPYPDIIPNEYKHFRSGEPVDALAGDIGYQTVEGYGLGILSGGPAYMRANPMSSIEFFDLDTSVKLNSLNYIHNHSLGYESIVYNQLKKMASKKESLNIDAYLGTSYAYNKYYGSIGNFITEYIDQSYLNNLSSSGRVFTATKDDIVIGCGTIPKIERPYNNFNPEIKKEDDEKLNSSDNFTWLEKGLISQEKKFIEYTEKDTLKTFKLSSDDNTSTNILSGYMHVRNNGSIILTSKAGSSIELDADGDITITPKRHLKIQTGGNTSIVSGNFTQIVSKNDINIRSTDSSVQTIAETNNTQISKGVHYCEAKTIVNKGTESIYNHSKDINNKALNDIKDEAYSIATKATKIDSSSVQNQIESTVLNINTDITQLKAKSRIMMSSGILHWGGKLFKLVGSDAGAILAGTPVKINHVHDSGFRYVYCGRGRCKVVRIESVIDLGNIPEISIPSVDYSSISVPEQTELSTGASEDEIFYFTPWQQSSKINWPGLTQKVNNTLLFPANNELYNIDSTGTKLEKKQWSEYTI